MFYRLGNNWEGETQKQQGSKVASAYNSGSREVLRILITLMKSNLNILFGTRQAHGPTALQQFANMQNCHCTVFVYVPSNHAPCTFMSIFMHKPALSSLISHLMYNQERDTSCFCISKRAFG